LPTIISDLSITPFQAGVVLTSGSLAFALLQFPSGRLSDQLNRKTVILSSLCILILGSLVLSISFSFLILLVGVAIVGMGEGLYGPADRGLLSDLFTQKRGAAFGIHTAFSDIGGILASGLATGALVVGIWRMTFLPAIAALVIIIILLFREGKESIHVEYVTLGIGETFGRLFYTRRFQWLVFAYILWAFTLQGVVGFLPSLLQADQNFSPAFAGAAFAGMFAVGIIARPLAGRLSDSIDRLVIGAMGCFLGSFGILVLVFASSHLMTISGIILFALGQKAFPPVMQAHLMDTFPDGSMAGDLGATRAVYIALGSLGPLYVGYISEGLSYTIAFAGFIITIFVSGIIIFALSITK
jgi:MFS family permease